MKQTWLTKLLCGAIIGIGVAMGVAFATVTGTYTPSRVLADGNTTAYSFSFAVPAQGDLVVELVNTTSLAVTNQTLTTDYTVTLSKSTPGGHIDFVTAPAAGQYVQLYRDIDVTQPTDIPAGGLFREVQIENALDRSVLLLQQQQEQLDRTIKLSLGTNSTDMTIPAPVADNVLGWNLAGTALENKELSDLSAIAKATTSDATTATNDDRYMTPAKVKSEVEYSGAVAIPQANIVSFPVKATGAEINTGTDDAKFVTAKALADSTIPKEGVWADYSSQSTIVGWDAAQVHTFQIYIKKIGKTVFFAYYLTGVSNATTISFTLPYTSSDAPVAFGGVTNDSVDGSLGVGEAGFWTLNAGANGVSIFKTAGGGTWTASGNKTVRGQGWFEATN